MELESHITALHQYLVSKKSILFDEQHRKSPKLAFNSFAVGTGIVQPGFKQHVGKRPGFIMHNFKETGVQTISVEEQLSKKHKAKTMDKALRDAALRDAKLTAYRFAHDILQAVDPWFAAGEYAVQFALMTAGGHVKWHTDRDDITYQVALSVGNFKGAYLRAYTRKHKEQDKDSQPYIDIDYKDKIVKFDARLPHEVVLKNFEGERFTIIFYKGYDRRMTRPEPILPEPVFVYERQMALPAIDTSHFLTDEQLMAIDLDGILTAYYESKRLAPPCLPSAAEWPLV